MHRVRSLISQLNYSELKKNKILPKQLLFTGIKRGGTFPKIAKKIGYAQFGFFLDHFIRLILSLHHSLPVHFKTAFELFQNIQTSFGSELLYDKKTFYKDRKYYESISTFICNAFEEAKNIEFEPEWNCGEIVGHPDLVIDDTVYDIKTTGQFGAMRTMTIFQVLAYYCLAKASEFGQSPRGCKASEFGQSPRGCKASEFGQSPRGCKASEFGQSPRGCKASEFGQSPRGCKASEFGQSPRNLKLTHIGLVLPAQLTVLRVDVSKWDWQPFWKVLCSCVAKKIQPSLGVSLMYFASVKPYVGSHVNKTKNIASTLMNLPSEQPWQIFFGGRASGRFKIADSDVINTLQLIVNQNYRLYVHAPYTLNLSKKFEDNWVVTSLQKHLLTASAMGCKGVVVHCGVKAKNVEFMTAYENMFNAVIEAATSATEECPLLIETSAGETGELLSEPEEMIRFYHSLPIETKEKVQICVDTCHVFSAGHMPDEYIRKLFQAKVPIKMYHFNDSRVERGARRDKHACIGTGFIGLESLIKSGSFAIQNGIDLVSE